jgi:hypothetical protein
MEFPNMAPKPHYDGVSSEALELGYQPETVPIRGLLVLVVCVAASAVILQLSLWWLMNRLEARNAAMEAPMSVLRDDQTPPEPGLQPSVGHDTQDYQDLAAVRRGEDEIFQKLGWIVRPGDKDAQIPPEIIRRVAEQQRARAAGAFVPPTTTGKNTNSILPTTIPASDTRSDLEGGAQK